MHKVFYSENYLRACLQDKKKTDWRQNETQWHCNGNFIGIDFDKLHFYMLPSKRYFLLYYFTKVFVGFYVIFVCFNAY